MNTFSQNTFKKIIKNTFNRKTIKKNTIIFFEKTILE